MTRSRTKSQDTKSDRRKAVIESATEDRLAAGTWDNEILQEKLAHSNWLMAIASASMIAVATHLSGFFGWNAYLASRLSIFVGFLCLILGGVFQVRTNSTKGRMRQRMTLARKQRTLLLHEEEAEISPKYVWDFEHITGKDRITLDLIQDRIAGKGTLFFLKTDVMLVGQQILVISSVMLGMGAFLLNDY